eukprot:jgi/Tetstr1/449831/TSEL_036894.t1
MRRDRGSVRGSAAAKNRHAQQDAVGRAVSAKVVEGAFCEEGVNVHDHNAALFKHQCVHEYAPDELRVQQLRAVTAIIKLSSAEDAEVKVGGPLTPARLCAFNNTLREAVQGMNVYTCLEDAEDSTDESYEARFVCHWGKEQLVAAEYRFAAGNRFQHPPT